MFASPDDIHRERECVCVYFNTKHKAKAKAKENEISAVHVEVCCLYVHSFVSLFLCVFARFCNGTNNSRNAIESSRLEMHTIS